MELDFKSLVNILPKHLGKSLKGYIKRDYLLEIILDLDNRPEVRFLNMTQYISFKCISWADLNYIVKRIGKFNKNNRVNIKKTLHRISCIRNEHGIIVGLTCRIGRSGMGTINIIRDFIEIDSSLLILGKPGTGKTTVIREISRILSDEQEKRVIVIDKSNEIGGNDNIVHPSIGSARRMEVSDLKSQHDIMIEAIENHMPEVIIIDEISTEIEVLAAKTIAERGVQLIATAHGENLSSLLNNPSLTSLIGGLVNVVLSDEEAKKRGTKKTILERKDSPIFQFAIELYSRGHWKLYDDLTTSIDRFLLTENLNDYQVRISHKQSTKVLNNYSFDRSLNTLKCQNLLPIYEYSVNSRIVKITFFEQLAKNKIFVLVYLVSRSSLKKLKFLSQKDIILTTVIQKADLIVTSNSLLRNSSKFYNTLKKDIIIYGINEDMSYKNQR